MLVRQTFSRRPGPTQAPSSPARSFSVPLHAPIDQTPVPGWPETPTQYYLLGGGMVTNIPDAPIDEGAFNQNVFIGAIKPGETVAQDPLVRIETTTTHVESEQVWRSSVGNGVDPYTQTNINLRTAPPGSYVETNALKHLSGRTDVVEYTYTVTPAAGSVIPTEPPPPATSAPDDINFHSIPADAPQSLKDAATLVSEAPAVFSRVVAPAEAHFIATGDGHAAVNMELDGVEDLIVRWESVRDNTFNDNLKAAATNVVTFLFAKLFHMLTHAHNTGSEESWSIVDASYNLYAEYGTWAQTQSANSIKGVDYWYANIR